jgi:hypothetical protein
MQEYGEELAEAEKVMDVDSLSERQKFAIAVMGGAQIQETEYRDGRLHMKTEPVSIQLNMDGNGWTVFRLAPVRSGND